VEEFASETATVVVGTVIDPELRDELRVTVVATGLGARMEKPVKVVDNTPAPAAARQSDATAPNYRDLDRPTDMLNTDAGGSAAPARLSQPAEDLDYQDIPAFLRRQAD